MIIFVFFNGNQAAVFLVLTAHKAETMLVFLLRKTAVVPLTKAKLIKLLRPSFSEEGSNQRQQENAGPS